ncbi:MAG: RluA family pseudouridine synthase [Synechococcales cyanobacterium]
MQSYSWQVEVPEERLDRWLAQQHGEISRARWQKLITQGQVTLNGAVCQDKNQSLAVGDRVTVGIPDPTPLDLVPQDIPLQVLYEDEDLLVINKSVGMVVHPSPGHGADTLVNALLSHCPQLSGINGVQRPGIVHRLDRDTSGALVIAKTDVAHQHLQAQIQAKTASRDYLGVVIGRPQTPQGRIETYIGRHPVDRQRMAVVEPGRGRLAITHWRLLEGLGQFSLMRFQLETGRTHQIRVHCTHMGWPLLGDPVYGSSRSSPVKLPGQALHAWILTFRHPRSGEEIRCQAPLPDPWPRLLGRLGSRLDLTTGSAWLPTPEADRNRGLDR